MTRRRRTLIIAGSLVLVAVLATGCASPNETTADMNPDSLAGFWSGLWDGLTATLAFFGTLLGLGEWNVYEVHNNGAWYNFGFLIGIGAIFGGGASAR